MSADFYTDERMLTASELNNEDAFDKAIRPKYLSDLHPGNCSIILWRCFWYLHISKILILKFDVLILLKECFLISSYFNCVYVVLVSLFVPDISNYWTILPWWPLPYISSR